MQILQLGAEPPPPSASVSVFQRLRRARSGGVPAFASVFGLASVAVSALVGWCSPALLLLIRGGLLEGGRRIPLVSASTAVREESILWWSRSFLRSSRVSTGGFGCGSSFFSGLVLCCFSPRYLLGVDRTREVRMRLSSVSSPTPHLRWRTMWPCTLCILLLQGTMDVCMQPPVELFPGERVRGSGLPRSEAVGEALRLFTAPCATDALSMYLGFTHYVRTSGPSVCYGLRHSSIVLSGNCRYGARHGRQFTLHVGSVLWLYPFVE
ncbi:hypothetical protein Taro_006172 [Colocasia esculenta]|uniref:Uncharacterized protein n=1 Tax=Colocasia esculenta TaxID=4460 RepID=A0A843TWA7_COLES|nr:hypothetical protein [Colocasia esculenta]